VLFFAATLVGQKSCRFNGPGERSGNAFSRAAEIGTRGGDWTHVLRAARRRDGECGKERQDQ
jgi:hypothetical protein